MACQMFWRLTRRVTSLIRTGVRRLERSFLCTHRKLISADGNELWISSCLAWRVHDTGPIRCAGREGIKAGLTFL